MNSEMTVKEWKAMAKARLLSDLMPEEEWDSVLDALLRESEGSGIEIFDDVIQVQWDRQFNANN
jgi:hypothetical protein